MLHHLETGRRSTPDADTTLDQRLTNRKRLAVAAHCMPAGRRACILARAALCCIIKRGVKKNDKDFGKALKKSGPHKKEHKKYRV
uniref:Uncharacterized protein n=1 Tax=Oryza rufipogon TaxID=4529 RepID=A0A0E0NY30_ORYRU